MREPAASPKPFHGVATVLVHKRKRVLAATGLITIISLLMWFRMDFNADVSLFMTEGSAEGQTFAALQEKYETTDPINVMLSLPDGETFADGPTLAELARTRDALQGLEEITLVTSLVPDEIPAGPMAGTAVTPEMLEELPAFAVGQISASNPFTDLLLSEDGQHTLLMAMPDGDPIDAVRAVQELDINDRFEVTISGNPAIYAEIIEILSFFLLFIPPTVIALLLLTFYSNVGNRKLTILSVVPAFLGSIWTFGVIFGAGREIDIVTVIVPIFVIVMGSADGLHFVTHYQDVAAKTTDQVERVRSTLEQVGRPMILTTISTAVGFLSLFAADVGPIRSMGLLAAIGITLAGVISFFTLPAIMTHLAIEGRTHPPRIGGALVRALQAAVRTRVPAVVLAIALVAFSAYSIPQIGVDSDPLFMFSDDHEVRLAFDRTEDLFGGATPLIGEFAYDPADPEGSLAAAADASALLEAEPAARTVISLATLGDRLPEGSLDAVLNGEVELPTGPMVSDDGLRYMLLTQDIDVHGIAGLQEVADSNETIVSLTGMTVIWDSMADLVLSAQIWSVATALLLVAVMLFAVYRRLRPTLVALVPLVLTLGTLLGFIAISGINLNLITAIASSIVIGVGIDYAIHFVAAIQYAEQDGPGYVHRAIRSAGRPIIANALGIAIGLTGLWLSPLQPHHHISLIMWVSMTVAAASALIIIPALLPREGVRSSEL